MRCFQRARSGDRRGRSRIRHRWWVSGWEICRSNQNCASRRDGHGRGSQAAQPGPAQLILVPPSGVVSSTGRCAAVRRWWRVLGAAVCIGPLLLGRVRLGVLILVPSWQDSNGDPAQPVILVQREILHASGIAHPRHRTAPTRRTPPNQAMAELSDLGLPGLFRRTSMTFAQTDRSPSARATAMR
jgi:hypothetical protein